MFKTRSHNEWFRTVSLGGRKSCPCCGTKLTSGESIWSWGEYICGRWHTVKYFCENCFCEQVKGPLLQHKDQCGCNIELVGKGDKLPNWLTLESLSEEEIAAATEYGYSQYAMGKN